MEYENEKLKEFEQYIRNKKVAIIGLGVSNIPLIDYFHEKKSQITVFDSREKQSIPKEIIEKIEQYKIEESFRKKLFIKIRKI